MQLALSMDWRAMSSDWVTFDCGDSPRTNCSWRRTGTCFAGPVSTDLIHPLSVAMTVTGIASERNGSGPSPNLDQLTHLPATQIPRSFICSIGPAKVIVFAMSPGLLVPVNSAWLYAYII